MLPLELLLRGFLPATIAFLVMMGAALALRRFPRVVRTLGPLAAGGAYLAGYVVLIGLPSPPKEAWQAMLPAAAVATIGALVIEAALPALWTLLAYPLLALVVAWLAVPAKLEPHATWLIVTAAAMALPSIALRFVSEKSASGVGALAGSVVTFAAGLTIFFLDNAKIAQPALFLAAPLGGLAVFALWPFARPAARAAAPMVSLIVPPLLVMTHFYALPVIETDPLRLPLWAFALLAGAPLLTLIALLPPIRRRPWLAVLTSAALVAGAVIFPVILAARSAPLDYSG